MPFLHCFIIITCTVPNSDGSNGSINEQNMIIDGKMLPATVCPWARFQSSYNEMYSSKLKIHMEFINIPLARVKYFIILLLFILNIPGRAIT